MGQDSAVDFIHLADEENSVLVRVLGRHMPGVLQWHDHLDAEIVVASGFARGRLDVCLSPVDQHTESSSEHGGDLCLRCQVGSSGQRQQREVDLLPGRKQHPPLHKRPDRGWLQEAQQRLAEHAEPVRAVGVRRRVVDDHD